MECFRSFSTVQKYLISGSGIFYQCILPNRQFNIGRIDIGNAQVENSRGGSLFKTFVLTVLEFRVKNVPNRKRSNSSFEPFRIPKIPLALKFKSRFTNDCREAWKIQRIFFFIGVNIVTPDDCTGRRP